MKKMMNNIIIKRKRLSQKERQKIYDKCHGHCAYCGCDLEYKDMQGDHMIPLYNGGTDTIDNMLPACRSCNHYKSTLTPEKFRKYISEIPKRLQRDSIPFQVGMRFGIIRATNDVEFYYERMRKENNG